MNIPQLRFPEFSGEWIKTKLGDIAENMTDYVAAGSFESLRNNVTVYEEPNYALYVRLTDLRLGIYHKGLKYVDKSSYDFLKKSNLYGGEILIANIGANVGDSYLMPQIDEPATIAPNMIVIRENINEFTSQFLYYWLNTREGRKSVNTAISGSSQPKMNKTDLKQIEVIITSKQEQEKIASFLTSVDTKIQQLTKKEELLSAYKKGVMQKIFSQEIRFKADDGSEFLDWEEQKLGDILDYEQPTNYIIDSTEYNDSFDIPVLTAGKSFVLGYTNETHNIFKNIPVIIFDDFTTANKYVDFPFKVKSSAMKILKPKDSSVNIRLIFEFIQMLNFPIGEHKRYWISEYQNLKMPLPSIKEQTKIAKFLSSIDNKIEQVGEQLDKSKEFKKALLQQMFV